MIGAGQQNPSGPLLRDVPVSRYDVVAHNLAFESFGGWTRMALGSELTVNARAA